MSDSPVVSLTACCGSRTPGVEGKPRMIASADSIRTLKRFAARWRFLLAPVGHLPGAFGDTWQCFEMREPWVCGGVPRDASGREL